MNTNIMVGATSEYEDHVWYYEQNQEYHRQYDLKLIIKQENTSISCNNLFIKIVIWNLRILLKIILKQLTI